MKITRDNYEAFFLDFLEGNLEESQIDQFLDFLEQNPDLKQELHLFEEVNIPEEKVVFTGKNRLYKTEVAGDTLDNRMIAHLEGDLDEDERSSFEAYLAANPGLQKEYNLFGKTKLIADQNIKFSGKRRLYRKSAVSIALNWAARAAAVIALLWGINAILPTMKQPFQQNVVVELAENASKSEPASKKAEQEKNSTDSEVPSKVREEKTTKTKSIREHTKGRLEEKKPAGQKNADRELASLPEIPALLASLEPTPIENRLAVSYSMNVQKINDPKKLMTLDEFLASRAKKAGTEGLLSAQRIVKAGLGLASELSGDRIGYNEQDGRITSIGFESKLMAFSIPLKKK